MKISRSLQITYIRFMGKGRAKVRNVQKNRISVRNIIKLHSLEHNQKYKS